MAAVHLEEAAVVPDMNTVHLEVTPLEPEVDIAHLETPSEEFSRPASEVESEVQVEVETEAECQSPAPPQPESAAESTGESVAPADIPVDGESETETEENVAPEPEAEEDTAPEPEIDAPEPELDTPDHLIPDEQPSEPTQDHVKSASEPELESDVEDEPAPKTDLPAEFPRRFSSLPRDSMVTVPLSAARTSFVEEDRQDEEPRYSVEWLQDERKRSMEENALRNQGSTSKRASIASQASSRTSTSSNSSGSGADVRSLDWVELEKTEEQESKAVPEDDESTALLLARLEQENNALATDPKSALSKHTLPRTMSRPPSVQQLKRLVDDPVRSSLRFSQLPPPQMTELEFWAALVADYQRTAQKLPTLTLNKIRAGVPPPLRGVVWPSIAGARDASLQEEFERLCGESSPYEGIIGKDIGRSWPNVDMFKDPKGDGQQMLARVLKCFSLHDTKIGYCQGLGFVVGPLLMHMSEAEAFGVLVRLMDHYDLQSCFQPTLSGLHLRIYQFQTLLSRLLPNLHAHLDELRIEPIYVSQWFLSFFAVTCPLPMLFRIYDVLLLEGACETLMRVALSLMQRNEEKLLACTELEDVMTLLLSRNVWDTYALNADDLVSDFVSLTSLVTRESLQSLEASYNSQGTAQGIPFPQISAVASRFLGRLWAGSASTKSLVLGSAPAPSTPSSVVRRTPSKQSMASTLNSFESTSEASTAATEMSSVDQTPKRKAKQQNKDKDLHTQIEDLLMALTDMQREQAALAKELQREREEREEDQKMAAVMIGYIKEQPATEETEELLSKASGRFSSRSSKRLSSLQTKKQLREDVIMWKEKYEVEATRCQNLSRSLDEHVQQNSRLKEELREARNRVQESHQEKQRLERTVHDLRAKTPSDRPDSVAEKSRSSAAGLREFRLGKSNTAPVTSSKRSSSSLLFSATSSDTADNESLLAELVTAKTAEAVARQELEEVKAKLETLRKLISRNPTAASSISPGSGGGANITVTPPPHSSTSGSPAPSPSVGGFFSGWTRRTASTTNAVIT